MKARVSKARTCRPHQSNKASQNELLENATRKRRGKYSEPPLSQIPNSRKRPLDSPYDVEPSPAKKARLTHSEQTRPLRRSARLQARQGLVAVAKSPISLGPPASFSRPPGQLLAPALLPPKRASLTRENLRRLNKMARSKRAIKERVSSSASSGSTTTTEESKSTAKTISTTSSGFEAQALENGILDRVRSKPPSNLDDRRAQLNKARETVSPTQSMYEDYVADVELAVNEQDVVVETTHYLLKKSGDKGYRRHFNQSLTALPKDAGFNHGLSAPQPDVVEGFHPQAFRPFPIAEQLGGAAVLVKDEKNSVTLPHLAGEWKGPGKDMMEARTQSAYDGAALVYGRNRALEYLGDADPAGHAVVSTFTTDGTSVNFFAHYSATSQEEAGKIEYHQYPITSTNLTNSFEEFKKGRMQLRNLQDYARDHSYDLRDKLKAHWESQRGAPHPVPHQARPVARDLEGITEEPSQDPEQIMQESRLYLGNDIAVGRPVTNPAPHKQTGKEVLLEALSDIDRDATREPPQNPAAVPTPSRSSKQGHQRQAKQRRGTASSSRPQRFRRPARNNTAPCTPKKPKFSSLKNDRITGQ
ncbi:hypothetical protein VTK56DRAFT_4145 [Thermocarpiscus australiensis]